MASGMTPEDNNLLNRIFVNLEEAVRSTNQAVALANAGDKNGATSALTKSATALNTAKKLIPLVAISR